MSRWALLAASGISQRMGQNKLSLPLAGWPLLRHSIELFTSSPNFAGVVLTLPHQSDSFPWLSEYTLHTCPGGDSRAASIMQGLKLLAGLAAPDDQIWVHDAARPCLTSQALSQLIDQTGEDIPAIVATRAVDSIKRADASFANPRQGPYIAEHCDRTLYWHAQTPQIARLKQLHRAYTHCLERGIEATDEAAALGQTGLRVRLIPTPVPNPKITCPQDVLLARQLLERPSQ